MRAVDLRAVDLRAVVRALPPDDPELAFAVLAVDPAFDLAAAGAFRVTAVRSLSKSLSACLLVFAASRRSAVIAAVTSL